MDLATYQTLTGITVSADKQTFVEATIDRIQALIESILGYSLDPTIASENQYNEIGISPTECLYTEDNLKEPDAVEFAYRIFPYNKNDKYLYIDPATSINKIKLVRNGITLKEIESDYYSIRYKNGIINYIEVVKCWCEEFCGCECDSVQLAIDAVWVGAGDYNEDTIPTDLLYVWADLVKDYTNTNRDIRSETLGTHSYTKDLDYKSELKDNHITVLKKYAGPNGELYKTITI